MITYKKNTNELIYETKTMPQLYGNYAETIIVEDYDSSNTYYLEFKCSQNGKFISNAISFTENNGNVLLNNRLFKNIGKVFVQLVVRNRSGEIIKKSLVSKVPIFVVEPSINATIGLDVSKVDDCLTSLISVANEYVDINNKLSEEIKMRLESEETLKQQINNKANIDSVNLLSMCPTDITETILTKETLSSFNGFIAPQNGYIYVDMSVNPKLGDGSNFTFAVKDKHSNTIYSNAYRVNGVYDNTWRFFLPIAKGMKFIVYIEIKAMVESLMVNYIKAKDI